MIKTMTAEELRDWAQPTYITTGHAGSCPYCDYHHAGQEYSEACKCCYKTAPAHHIPGDGR